MKRSMPNSVVRTLVPMACDGAGPSYTCVNLLSGMTKAGCDTQLFVNRSRIALDAFPYVAAIPQLLAWLPYPLVAHPASRILESRFLATIQPNDIAYLWPAASLEIHRRLHAIGIQIVIESINSRMSHAKEILDRAYAEFDAPPSHGITDARIAEEEEKYNYASAIFAPNRMIETALVGSPLESNILSSSYGVDTRKAGPPRNYSDKSSLTYLFCGYACVRKGVHLLLNAWESMPPPHKLVLVGNIEPVIRERYRDLLDSERVECTGFVKDVHAQFSRADVFIFPSLEEGGPQVTYEAALHGLSIIASPMGASRLGETEGTMLIVDPENEKRLQDAMLQMTSTDLRAALGRRARDAVQAFDWMHVGGRRAALLREAFGLPAPDGGTGNCSN